MIQNLKKLSATQIAKITKQEFVKADFFKHFPDLKDKVSILIIGSIGYGIYDNQSDIDISLIFPQAQHKRYQAKIKQYKNKFKQSNRQIQLFYNTTFEQLSGLTDWQDDLKLREFANAIILHDPHQKFEKIQRRIKWYPANVHKEKIKWLFAEAVFELEDRYSTAAGRKDIFYSSVSKLKFLQLIMTISLLINKQYPIYEKHLFRFQPRLKGLPVGYDSLLKQIVLERNLNKLKFLMQKLRKITEDMLIAKRLIPQKDNLYWIDARPKYQVKLK